MYKKSDYQAALDAVQLAKRNTPTPMQELLDIMEEALTDAIHAAVFWEAYGLPTMTKTLDQWLAENIPGKKA